MVIIPPFEIIDIGQLRPIIKGNDMKKSIKIVLPTDEELVERFKKAKYNKKQESKYFRDTPKKHDKYYFSCLIFGIVVIGLWLGGVI